MSGTGQADESADILRKAYDLGYAHGYGEGEYPKYTLEELEAALRRLLVRERLQAQLNMVDYFDQCPANDLMDWKGLFADTRKLLEADIKAEGRDNG